MDHVSSLSPPGCSREVASRVSGSKGRALHHDPCMADIGFKHRRQILLQRGDLGVGTSWDLPKAVKLGPVSSVCVGGHVSLQDCMGKDACVLRASCVLGPVPRAWPPRALFLTATLKQTSWLPFTGVEAEARGFSRLLS